MLLFAGQAWAGRGSACCCCGDTEGCQTLFCHLLHFVSCVNVKPVLCPPTRPWACRKPYPHLLILTEHSSNLSLSPIKSSSCQGIPHLSKEVGQERSREGETTILAVGLPSLPLPPLESPPGLRAIPLILLIPPS